MTYKKLPQHEVTFLQIRDNVKGNFSYDDIPGTPLNVIKKMVPAMFALALADRATSIMKNSLNSALLSKMKDTKHGE